MCEIESVGNQKKTKVCEVIKTNKKYIKIANIIKVI